MSKVGLQSLSSIARIIRSVAECPTHYYLSDRASHTLVVYGVIKIVVLVGALCAALLATRWHFTTTSPVFPPRSRTATAGGTSASHAAGTLRTIRAPLLSRPDDWRKNLAIGTVAVAIAIENMYIWLSGAWLA